MTGRATCGRRHATSTTRPSPRSLTCPSSKARGQETLKPLFAVSLRLLASDEALLRTMEGFLKQFDSMDNGIIPISGTYPVHSIMARDTHVHGSILNSTELVYFVHLPAPELIDSMPCIERAAKSYPVPYEFTSTARYLDKHAQGYKEAGAAFSQPSQPARLRHWQVGLWQVKPYTLLGYTAN